MLPHLQYLSVTLQDLENVLGAQVALERDAHAPGTLHPPLSTYRFSSICRADYPLNEGTVWLKLDPRPPTRARERIPARSIHGHVACVFLERVAPSQEDFVRQLVYARSILSSAFGG